MIRSIPRNTTAEGRVHIFGIRHHGPGSSRSLKAAFETLRPDLVLVEGPPDANHLLPLALHEAMQPPVALLIYAPDDPSASAYYPFADYSPEWQAVRWALENGATVRMMDLAQAIQMGVARAVEDEQRASQPPDEEEYLTPDSGDLPQAAPEPEPAPLPQAGDPLGLLAEAAGYSESEQWWEHLVEQYRDGSQYAPEDAFAAILEAMTVLREEVPTPDDWMGQRREASMRQSIRAGLREGHQRIAVVCGAWHSPALRNLEDVETDEELLRDLPELDVRATWVPWTNARLSRFSGYGAGIESPGWYQHLWSTGKDVTERWMIHVARLLRSEDLDVSPANVIEAVRLAEALASLRGRPLPGLPELNEAALTVFCFGNPLPMRLIEEKLIVGDRLGSVPPITPMAPLQQDFDRQVARLKLPVEAQEKLLDLDLRRPLDLARSHLFHRLSLLGVPWGRNSDAALQAAGRGRGGTFHEIWRLKWQPELAVALIEAGQWGSTIAGAATARACHMADTAPDLVALTALVEDVLLAELPAAIRRLMDSLQAHAAVSADTLHLMQALPPLVSVMRYGNVRQTDSAMVTEVVDGLLARVCIGLPSACQSLNDEAAAEMFDQILQVEDAVLRLGEEQYRAAWLRALAVLADMPSAHGLIAGRAVRILLDTGTIDNGETARRLGLGLSTASGPAYAAAWIEGFLHGSGQILIHDPALLGLIDAWLARLPEEIFLQLLPLLRRTFGQFARPERRSIGERVKREGAGTRAAVDGATADFDPARAEAVLPLVAKLLGLNWNGTEEDA